MEFKNVEKFDNWLKSILKAEDFDLMAFLEDVDKQYGNTGSTYYEVGRFNTKSGNPECYSFDIEQIHNEDEDTWGKIYSF